MSNGGICWAKQGRLLRSKDVPRDAGLQNVMKDLMWQS